MNHVCLACFLFVGDNILTAVSVSRQCGMLSAGDQLVFANAYPPVDDKPARISWELFVDDSGDQRSSFSTDVRSSYSSETNDLLLLALGLF
jgi:magnesium-transporting ATPase (P-type)